MRLPASGSHNRDSHPGARDVSKQQSIYAAIACTHSSTGEKPAARRCLRLRDRLQIAAQEGAANLIEPTLPLTKEAGFERLEL